MPLAHPHAELTRRMPPGPDSLYLPTRPNSLETYPLHLAVSCGLQAVVWCCSCCCCCVCYCQPACATTSITQHQPQQQPPDRQIPLPLSTTQRVLAAPHRACCHPDRKHEVRTATCVVACCASAVCRCTATPQMQLASCWLPAQTQTCRMESQAGEHSSSKAQHNTAADPGGSMAWHAWHGMAALAAVVACQLTAAQHGHMAHANLLCAVCVVCWAPSHASTSACTFAASLAFGSSSSNNHSTAHGSTLEGAVLFTPAPVSPLDAVLCLCCVLQVCGAQGAVSGQLCGRGAAAGSWGLTGGGRPPGGRLLWGQGVKSVGSGFQEGRGGSSSSSSISRARDAGSVCR